jgi:hypothetical protein
MRMKHTKIIPIKVFKTFGRIKVVGQRVGNKTFYNIKVGKTYQNSYDNLFTSRTNAIREAKVLSMLDKEINREKRMLRTEKTNLTKLIGG